MALIKSCLAAGRDFLSPREYISYTAGNFPPTSGTYTSGTSVSNAQNGYGKSFIVNVKDISGTIELTATQNCYFNIVGVLSDGTISFSQGNSESTTSYSKEFSGIDYLIVATGTNGSPTITYTITES